ncbi:MAG TPA: PQQ-binding-like beta-propeller repeat protein [Caulobacteraceae bacterium]|nr:PQQ-binding-like beta-propeller repeat protein [Caulobacteraceae bacterium]
MTTVRRSGARLSRAPAVVSWAAAIAIAVAGCSTVSKIGGASPFHHKKHASTASKGTRIPIIALNDQLTVSDALKGQDFLLPPPTPNAEWPLPGDTPGQSVEHVDAAPAFVVAWRRGFGAPSSKRRHITATPISAGGRIFLMDGGAGVSAHDARTGARIWRTDIEPKSKRDHEGWGGGLAYADGRVYASSGFREVVALDAATGAIVWRTRTEAPVHAAPTVFGGRVFVADVNDELLAFEAPTGVQAWTYQALTEPARILAASSPAVDNDTVVTSFASGELVAVRASNGNELWNANLSRVSRTNALSEIRDIAGRPVIYKSDVYAVSHSDVLSAIDLRTGLPRWTLPVSAVTTPWVAGDVVYVVDQAGEVICVSRESGQVYWIRDLNAGVKKKKLRAYWSTPILASNRLITVSSKGVATAINPKTGVVETTLRLGAPALISPIAVGGLVYVVTDNAQLVAIR